jgi:hypothetical protein
VIDARDIAMGAWFESTIMKVTKSTSKPDKSEKQVDSIKPVLSESSLKTADNKAENKNNTPKKGRENSSKAKDVNENVKSDKSEAMETDDTPTSDSKTSGIKTYDKLFDNVLKDDGFVYHIVYEGFVLSFIF